MFSISGKNIQTFLLLKMLIYIAVLLYYIAENNFVGFAYNTEEMSVIKNLKDERKSFQDHNSDV